MVVVKNSLVALGKLIMPHIFRLPSPRVHFEMSNALLNPKIKKLNIIAPRGIAKSTLAVLTLVIHHIMFDRGPKVVVIVSRTQGHAVNLLQSIKDIFEYSSTFRKFFGYWGQHSARVWRNDLVILKDGSVIVCKGAMQQVRGLNFGGQRPTLMIIDDPEDENNTKTDEALDANLTWLLQSAVPALDAQRGRIILIGTPLHARSLVMICKELVDWTTLHYKYLNTDDKGNLYSLWEENLTVQQLLNEKEALEKIGKVSAWHKERQCEIVGDATRPFKWEDIRTYRGNLVREKGGWLLHITELNGNPLPVKRVVPVYTFIGVDPASSTNLTADFTVIFPVAVDSGNNIYCLPYFQKRVQPMEVADKIIEYWKRYKPEMVRIESNGYQEMIKRYLQRICEERGWYIPGLEIPETARVKKSKRLEEMQPDFAQHKVYMLPEMLYGEEFALQLVSYPFSKHDDILDAFYYARKKAYGPLIEEVVQEQIEEDVTELYYDGFIL